jgi:hypothetical protein
VLKILVCCEKTCRYACTYTPALTGSELLKIKIKKRGFFDRIRGNWLPPFPYSKHSGKCSYLSSLSLRLFPRCVVRRVFAYIIL